MHIYLYVVTLILSLPRIAMAATQPAAAITGTVTSEDKAAVSGAKVACIRIRDPLPKTGISSFPLAGPIVSMVEVTDGNGAFRFDGLQDGRYLLCASGTSRGQLRSCEWNAPQRIVEAVSGKAFAAPPLIIRQGVVVNIVAKNTGGKVQPGKGFWPGVFSDTGYYKRAEFVGQQGDELQFAVPVPRDAALRLLFDSEVTVQDEAGMTLRSREPSLQLPSFDSGEITIRLVLP